MNGLPRRSLGPRLAASRDSSPQLKQFIAVITGRTTQWGLLGRLGMGPGPGQAQKYIHPVGDAPTEIPVSPPDLTPRNTPFHIQRDVYPPTQGYAGTPGDDTQTLTGTHVCLMWQKAARETATPSGMAQRHKSREKLGFAHK